MSRTEDMVQDRIAPYKQEQDVPDGYKRTEVGVIPEDWEVTEIKSLGQVVTGNTPPTNNKSNYGDSYLFVSPYDLGKNKFINQTQKKLSERGFRLTRNIPAGSSLFTCIGSTIGKVGIASKSLSTNQQINSVIPYNGVNNEYIYYSLLRIGNEVKERAGQQAVPIVNKTEFSRFQVPLPTPLEQRAIATALSDVDHLLESLDKLIAKKRAIKQAAMQELLTGKTRLPGFRGEWEKVRLGDLGTPYGGLTGKAKNDFGQGNAFYVPFLNVMSNVIIDNSELSLVDLTSNEKQNQVKKGDLIFNGTSETPDEVGMCAVLLEGFENLYLNSFCIGFRPHSNEVDGLYLAYYFRSDEGRKIMKVLAQGATRYNLSKTALKDINFPLPQFSEQQAIATILYDMDKEIESLEKRRDKTRQIKQGMMQELLTGRIRLVKDTSKAKTQNSAPVRRLSSQNRNWQFEEAVIIAVLADTFGKREFPLNRFRYQKMVYLLRRFTEQETEGFLKKAAGPYKPASRYKGPEKIALDKQYVQEIEAINRNGKKYNGFISGEMIQEARDYFEKWFGSEALQWLQQFKFEKSEKLELLTTVDMAVQDLKTEGKPVSVEAVQQLINNHEEWRPKLKRRTFSSDNIHYAIEKIEQLLNVSE